MNVLLTGVGGFIGAHCLEYFLDHTDWNIVGIDSWEHKGTPRRILDLLGNKLERYQNRYTFIKHDLTVPFDRQLINLIYFRNQSIDIIINMASDSAVERSGENPVLCLKNNYHLMINMLEYARICKPKIFFHVSTDEVYGESKPEEGHKEWSSIIPSNPYSASKAAQEAVAISYWRCFDVPVVITNTVNNYGEAQDPEKFLPKIIQKIYNNETMPIYADSIDDIGTRFYLHAKEHADVFKFLSNFEPKMYNDGENQLPDRYNVGSHIELNNLELAQRVAKILNKELKWELIKPKTIRKGYDRRYNLDSSKITDLGWKPFIDFDTGLKNVIEWTIKNEQWAM